MRRHWIPLTVIFIAIISIGVAIVSAQGAEPPKVEYVGSQACAGCHQAEHAHWADSLHPRMIQDPKVITTAILADFTRFTEVITDPKLKYDAKDVIFTMGWRYRQRYILRDPKTRRLVMGAGQWNIASQGPFQSDNKWQSAKPGDDWLNECAGCHTTGLNLEVARKFKVGDKTLPYVEPGIGCEACHGPGGEHVKNPNKNTIPVNKIEALDATICGQCHTRGTSPEVEGKTHGYPIGYTPGDKLTDKNFIPFKFAGTSGDANWWNDGHARRHRQQYLEWVMSGHARALQTIQKIDNAPASCLGCHSADYIAITSLIQSGQAGSDIVTPTVKSAQFAITCQVCHAPHKEGTQPFDSLLRNESYQACTACHNATADGTRPLTSGAEAHYPMQEMFEGKGALDVESKPSPHFTSPSGPVCAACHMPGTATSADTGDIASHNWKIILPGKAEEKESDACSACHSNPARASLRSAAELQTIIDTRQNEVKDKLKALNKLLKDVKSAHAEWDPKAEKKTERQIAYEKAFTNISFVETEGSFGLHNYEYAKAVLDKAEEQLKFAAATPTPTPTVIPTATPEPTPTPFVLPPTPTPIPPPSGGATWPIWVILFAVIVVVGVLLVARRPTAG